MVFAIFTCFPMLMIWFNNPHDISKFTPAYAFLVRIPVLSYTSCDPDDVHRSFHWYVDEHKVCRETYGGIDACWCRRVQRPQGDAAAGHPRTGCSPHRILLPRCLSLWLACLM